MPVLKAVNKPYKTAQDLKNLINYAVKGKEAADGGYGAQGVLKGEAESMYCQMEGVKKYFRKENKRQALHYVLSFSGEEMEYIGIREALEIGYAFAGCCCLGWQVVFGIHTDTDSLHVHFIVNSTSYENGRAFDMGPAGLQEAKEYVKAAVQSYYIRSLPEEERRETVCRKAGAMVEIPICSPASAEKPGTCSAGDSRRGNTRLFERL